MLRSPPQWSLPIGNATGEQKHNGAVLSFHRLIPPTLLILRYVPQAVTEASVTRRAGTKVESITSYIVRNVTDLSPADFVGYIKKGPNPPIALTPIH